MCTFITDGYISDQSVVKEFLQEQQQHGDILFQPVGRGPQFGFRFLIHIKWATAKFNFQFLLRMDDDYFLCIKRLLNELPLRPKQNLCWGHYHCAAGNLWMDEGWMIFSRNIIETFLAQKWPVCHPFADQMIAIWLNNVSQRLNFHDVRLHHHPPASYVQRFKTIANVCDSYLGLHGTYPEEMRYFDKNSNDGKKDVPRITHVNKTCRFTTFNWKAMRNRFRRSPKPCDGLLDWGDKPNGYKGRQRRAKLH